MKMLLNSVGEKIMRTISKNYAQFFTLLRRDIDLKVHVSEKLNLLFYNQTRGN